MEYIPYESIVVTVVTVAAAMSFVVLTWNAVRAIIDWRKLAKKPTDDRLASHDEKLGDHEERISHLEECCSEVRGKLQSDWEWQQASAEKDELMLRSIKQLLKHSVDGNDTSGLVKMENEIDDYLIKHQQH
ncbi:MAG: hypothetical protein IJF97_09755 [Eggerthellaceae bacterium]|nr:hypothetical protein [Eggerthellaceae bacterium]